MYGPENGDKIYLMGQFANLATYWTEQGIAKSVHLRKSRDLKKKENIIYLLHNIQ